jgi:hypothetical protein
MVAATLVAETISGRWRRNIGGDKGYAFPALPLVRDISRQDRR